MAGWIGALFLIAVGAGLLVVAWRGWNRGELPAGSKGLQSYRPNRESSPAAFHFFFLLYVAGGIALTVWGLLILIGAAAPLKLQ
jgi:hypothetical protein